MQTKSTNGNQRTMKTSELVRRFLPYFRPYRGMLALDLFCATLTTLCDLVLPMIVRSITGLASGSAAALTGFCAGIQHNSPVDSFADPEPADEPGYTDKVVMASGSFTEGSTIEISCDGPLRTPYTCYLQGGVNFTAGRAAVLNAVQNAFFAD